MDLMRELLDSIKWSVWLFPLWALLLFGALTLLGGIHGLGGALLVVGEAPVVLLQSVFQVEFSSKPGGWIIVVLLDWLYFLAWVALVRFLLRRRA
jgi:hypothetical protein